MFGEALTAAASIGGALISSASQQSMNAENIRNQNIWNSQTLAAQMAQHQQNTDFMEDQQSFNRMERQYAQDFSANQAEIARGYNWRAMEAQNAFQQAMASSQYQRAMADMRAAGLNPILAYQRGGNASPAGGSSASPAPTSSGATSGMASGSSVSPHYAARGEADLNIGRAVGNIATSAIEAMKTIASIENIKQVTAESAARTDKVKEETQTEPVRRTQMAMETIRTSHDIENVKANLKYILAQTDRTLLEAGLTQEMIENMRKYGSREAPGWIERLSRILQDAAESGLKSYGINPSAPPPAPDPQKGAAVGTGIGGFIGRMFRR